MCKVISKVSNLLTSLGYVIFGAFILPVLCVGQVAAVIPADHDSLCRHIFHDYHTALRCNFTYARNAAVIFGWGDNALELARLDGFIRLALSHPDYSVGRIRLTGYCSIDGRYSYNEVLARERVEQFYAYLRGHYPALREYPYDLAWVAEDWVGLSRLVKDSSIDERDEILDIIRKVRAYDEREALLVRLNGGRAYAAMKRTMLPLLRRVELQIEYKGNEPIEASPHNSTKASPCNSTASPQSSPKEREHDAVGSSSLSFGEDWGEAFVEPVGQSEITLLRPLFAIKSNLLQWASVRPDFSHTTFLPNLSLEYFVTPHWSLELGAMYSYWHYGRRREFQGVSGYRVEPRYRWTLAYDRVELFLGAYFRSGDYDVTTTTSAPHTGGYWDAGLSSGFTVSLVGGWAVEVGARAGYLSTDAIRYNPDGKHNWFVSEHPYGKVKVTDLNISLIYRFRFRSSPL